VVFWGRDFDEAREYCEKQAAQRHYRYIHSGNEPALIAGVATCTLEILEVRPDTEAVVVPVGGGSGAAGACVVAKAVRPSIEVIGVQSEAAPAALAAVLSAPERFAGRKVAIVCSGGNMSPAQLTGLWPLATA
jgi:threonine dehydratase